MKLHHFTPVSNIEIIKLKGLEPRLSHETIALVGRRSVVWLTDDTTTTITNREVATLLRHNPDRHIVSRRWMRADTDEPLARFTVNLLGGDRRLKRYGPWLRKQRERDLTLPDPDGTGMKRAMEHWWIYDEGFIRPAMIIDCQIEQPTKVTP